MAERLTDEWLARWRRYVETDLTRSKEFSRVILTGHDLLALLDEIDALRLSLAGRDKALELANAGLQSATEQLDRLKQEVRALRAENEALKGEVDFLRQPRWPV